MDPIIERIESLLQPLLADSDMFITSIRIKPTNNIKVFLDADSGLNVGKSAAVNRKLAAIIEEEGIFPDGDFSLEVSSPGVDEPLGSIRQYRKNIGRTVEVTLQEGAPVTGLLKEVLDDKIVVAQKLPKKKETADLEIPLDFIRQIVVQIVF